MGLGLGLGLGFGFGLGLGPTPNPNPNLVPADVEPSARLVERANGLRLACGGVQPEAQAQRVALELGELILEQPVQLAREVGLL